MRNVVVAATQMSCTWNIAENIARAEKMVYEAAASGAQIILLQELFETPYFCQEKNPDYFKYATTPEENQAIRHFAQLAKTLKVVLPISFYEHHSTGNYNSVAVIDADGEILGIYRKTHIPYGPGYEETFYFQPGDTGFKVWKTRYGTIGVGICWDQWFSEAARSMSLLGAELLLYPTAIGSEPQEPDVDSKNHWQLVMQGHAAANITPVIASNRVGTETVGNSTITFYGSSFITNEIGEKIAEADRSSETILLAEFDLDRIAAYREYWGIHKGRRPEMYKEIIKQKTQ
ncbi:MAG TPA: N-carbamoylputrescine amidase [Bacillota bacterium]|mgnify:FL=1|nr:N-carbamoylputrescine amidase [Bacillota bacterium]HPT88193.1 N-carbamoylputrescine amidase [Bacillota bacterium]